MPAALATTVKAWAFSIAFVVMAYRSRFAIVLKQLLEARTSAPRFTPSLEMACVGPAAVSTKGDSKFLSLEGIRELFEQNMLFAVPKKKVCCLGSMVIRYRAFDIYCKNWIRLV